MALPYIISNPAILTNSIPLQRFLDQPNSGVSMTKASTHGLHFRRTVMGCWMTVASFLFTGISRSEQFVLFDVTFTYSKDDAENSKPSKSHYYVKGDRLNKVRPKDWTSPVDYRNGSVHVRLEVMDKPNGDEPTTWSICYIPNKGQKNGYGCLGTDVYTAAGIYEKDISMTSFWENDSIVWTEGIKQMDLVIKDNSGGSGHAHKRADHEKFFPTKVRITLVQVSAGAKYDSKDIAASTSK